MIGDNMKTLTIYRDEAVCNTVIPNRFIDEYMLEANDAQIKIYLYLLRLISAHMSTGISEIADLFNYTEKDVLRALRYWEKKHLLSFDYDSEKNLTGIHFLDFPQEDKKNYAPIVSLSPDKHDTAQEGTGTAPAPISAEAATVSVSAIPAKPVYSLDRLRAFQNNESTRQLMFVAESYLGKPLSPTDIRTILYLSDGLHFSNDLIDYLIQYCVERGKKDFRYMEKVALSWAEQKITTPKEAAKVAAKYDKNTYRIMKALGKNDTPTEKEYSYIHKWTNDYAFQLDVIIEACERTVLATDKHRFEYADGILKNWMKNNVHRKADIAALDESRKQTAQSVPSDRNRFNQFHQNAYDFNELEKDILSN